MSRVEGGIRRPTRRLGTRLFVAIVTIAFAVLVASAAGTAALFRQTAADAALHDLRKKAPEVAGSFERLSRRLRTARNTNPGRAQRSALRAVITGVLGISSGSVVVVAPNGDVLEGVSGFLGLSPAVAEQEGLAVLPKGLKQDDLDSTALLAGKEQSGQRGRTVFVADPLKPVRGFTPVVVLSKEVEDKPLSRAGGFFLIAGGLALVAAAVVAFLLSRRLTRPLAAMEQTANRIADGDLSARVELGRHPDDELAGLARALDGMAAQLEAARGLERGFLLSVSHDLRTPLTSIKGYAEAIAEGAVESPEEQKRAAEVITAEARRLERLVADLLDLARLDAHEFSLTPQPVDAAEVVGEAVDAFRPSASELGVELRFVGDGSVPADADSERLAQIVANLLENALKYARSQVTVGLSAHDGAIELRVDDDGPGLDPADVPHVFERLYTSRTAPGRKVGTGLGLAIVRELAAAMGGTAVAQSLDGRGTRFLVRIPAGC